MEACAFILQDERRNCCRIERETEKSFGFETIFWIVEGAFCVKKKDFVEQKGIFLKKIRCCFPNFLQYGRICVIIKRVLPVATQYVDREGSEGYAKQIS